jgi:tetratricopeptide (TPR) repeat protein
MSWRKSHLAASLLGSLFAVQLHASSDILLRARLLYDRTNYEASLKILNTDHAPDGATYALLGKNYFQTGDLKRSIDYLEKAADLEPANAEHALWLGRAWGRRAEKSNFVSAPHYAAKARQYFEKAVELDSHNREALDDLFLFYLEAPGFLGGGSEKAAAIAKRTESLSAPEYHYDLAQLAEKRKDMATAEAELRAAMTLAPTEPGRVIDVAQFLLKRGRHEESDAMFRRAESIAPDSPQVVFARAKSWIDMGRNSAQARQLLERYLTLQLTPDDPSRAEVEHMLRQVGK